MGRTECWKRRRAAQFRSSLSQAEDLDALKTKLADAEHDYSVAKNSTDTAKTALSAERELAEGMDPGPAT